MAIKLVLYYLTTLAIGLTWYATEAVVVSFKLPPGPFRPLKENEILHWGDNGKCDLITASNPPANGKITTFMSQDVQLYLLTSQNPDPKDKVKVITGKQESLKFFNNTNPTRIVIHGWNTWTEEDHVLKQFAEAYFGNPNGANGGKVNHEVNFIYVDWSKGANPLNYAEARINVELAAKRVTEIINFIIFKRGYGWIKKLEMIAFSNGCHVMGLVGRTLRKNPVKTVPKMTALDPDLMAFPSNEKLRLAKTDSARVEVIVTCGGLLGILEPFGHATYYPNGGKKQPGCAPDDFICHRNRAVDYYVESINNPTFYAIKCDDLQQIESGKCSFDTQNSNFVSMGYKINADGPNGEYLLQTGSSSPFHLGLKAPFIIAHKVKLAGAMKRLNSPTS